MTVRTLAGWLLAAGVASAQTTPPPAAEKKYPDFTEVLKGAKYTEGAIPLHLKDDHLYAELLPQHFDKPYLFAAAVAKGAGMGGTTLLGDEGWVLTFHRVGDRVFLVRKNTRFQAKAGTPAAKATETTYSDSVLASLPVKTVNPLKGSVVVDLNQIFFTDFAQTGLGSLDASRTTWHKVKGFKKNVELQVAATFAGNSKRGHFGDGPGADDVIDSRGLSVILHYSLVELPETGYAPRAADDRVGHFISVVKDFNAAETRDSAFVRYVNRWRLERADGTPWKEGGKLAPPKKKIVFWIENSVPDEYRASVREGILEWNRAFEMIGFRDAIEVRQQEGEDFDPEDVTYATFRWVTNEQSFAIGPSRVNPLTGEILDADILFDASMIRANKSEYRVLRNEHGKPFQPDSEIEAGRRGWYLPSDPFTRFRDDAAWNDKQPQDDESVLRRKLHSLRLGYCQCAAHKTSELSLAAMHLAGLAGLKDGEKVPEELLQQAVKETVMHEVGHTLGLRHNFKASTVLKPEQLHDTAVTRKQGLVGSVMDYNPANIAAKGQKLGDYFSTTLGAYDYWAIEYAYKPVGGDDDLKKIASRAAEPQLIYGTDEDLLATADPLVNQWDLGSDPLAFARARVQVAKDLMPKLAESLADNGEGYQRVRLGFGRLLGQYGNAAFLAAKHVGGEALYRDHKGDPNARDPFVPVPAAKQREALKFLADDVFTDKAFTFPPELLRKLAADRWLHWGNEGVMQKVDFPLNDRVLGIQRVALRALFEPATLKRIQDSAAKAAKGEEPLTVAEVFRATTDAVFADLPNGDKPAAGASGVIRRNLQRAYLARLAEMTLGPKNDLGFVLSGGRGPVPPDARSLARKHLREISARVDQAIKLDDVNSRKVGGKGLDDAARAHLDETKEVVAKVLSATLALNDY